MEVLLAVDGNSLVHRSYHAQAHTGQEAWAVRGLLGQLVARSAWSARTNLIAAAVLVAFFAASVLGYIVHGALRDTDNQLARPHRLGRGTVSNASMVAFMLALIVGEIASATVILVGYLAK